MSFDAERIVKFWIESAERDWDVVETLFASKKYAYALFFCHLSTEKILKALVVKLKKKNPPYTHDLNRLAEIAGITMTPEQLSLLAEVSVFNIAGRYQDEKMEFFKKYNKRDVAEKYVKAAHELILWLKKKYPKK